MKKVIIINGVGTSGKDTLIENIVSAFKIKNISSIDPIKQMALQYGWDGNKDQRGRFLLQELKRIWTNYNDLSGEYIQKESLNFQNDDNEILFVHIREIENIREFRSFIKSISLQVYTLLVIRQDSNTWENSSDRDIYNYNYDFIFNNDKPLKESIIDFNNFLTNLI